MSDYPMLISNKLHSFRNFLVTNIHFLYQIQQKVILKNVVIRKKSSLKVCLVY